jgi:aspartate/tyrosine/aromatic aminotransferase
MRSLLADNIQHNAAGIDFSHIKQQKGMFSFLGLNTEQLDLLREDHGIYIVSSSRVNLAGINSGNIAYLSDSIVSVLG